MQPQINALVGKGGDVGVETQVKPTFTCEPFAPLQVSQLANMPLVFSFLAVSVIKFKSKCLIIYTRAGFEVDNKGLGGKLLRQLVGSWAWQGHNQCVKTEMVYKQDKRRYSDRRK